MSVWEALIELSVYVGGTARKDEVGGGNTHVWGVREESEWLAGRGVGGRGAYSCVESQGRVRMGITR